MVDLFAPRGRYGKRPSIADKIDADGDCWEWKGRDNDRGYAQVVIDGSRRYVHRLVWETLVGPIPNGLELDHLCRNTLCVNPDHLEVVSHAENVKRGNCGVHNRNKKRCPKGHLLSGSNLYVAPGTNKRHCRACRKEQNARRYRKEL